MPSLSLQAAAGGAKYPRGGDDYLPAGATSYRPEAFQSGIWAGSPPLSCFKFGAGVLVDTHVLRASPLIDLAWRTALRIAFPLAKIWWRLRRPQHEGALVAVHVGEALLLVRASYRVEWNFPGGGIKSQEAPEAAARRELAEEIGLVPPSMRPAGVIDGIFDGRPDRVHFFELRLSRLPELRLDNREIVEARLVSLSEIDGVSLTGPVAAYLRQTLAGALP